MEKENKTCESCCGKGMNCGGKGGCGGVGCGAYGLGFLGALIFFIQTAPTFWTGVLGVLKAFVWPVFVVYDLLNFLK